jgi:hypothetical protein
VPKPSPLLTHLLLKLAALALAGAGFWLVPEDPSFPALILTAIALPLALLFALAWLIIERREAARAKAADAACRGKTG